MRTCFNHVRDNTSNPNVFGCFAKITNVKNIAERLAHARSVRDWTQLELARHAGVSQSTIGNIESGSRKSPRELLAIAAAVGVSPEWLKTGKGPQDAQVAASEGHASLPPWPFRSVTAAELSKLPPHQLDQIERIVGTFLTLPKVLPDWRQLAIDTAAAVDLKTQREVMTTFIKQIDRRYAEEMLTLAESQPIPLTKRKANEDR